MNINEQRIKAMVVMNIIDNCTIELDNTGQERYSLDGNQFGKVVDALVKNIKVIQCCEVLPKTRKCDWCKKRKSVEQGYWLGKFENETKDWFICQECNLEHDVV